MPADSRLRRLATAALTVALASLIAGCVQNPNSVFHHRTDFNRDVTGLFKLLIWLGTIVFVFTEGMLLWAIVKYRSRPGKPRRPEDTAAAHAANRGRKHSEESRRKMSEARRRKD